MKKHDEQDLTGMLAAWKGGEAGALDRLMDVLYPELRRIAGRQLRRRRDRGSVDTGTLANEAYLKLAGAGGIPCENRVHFLALCSQIMRRLLVDHARKRGYAKRGRNAVLVTLDEAMIAAQTRGVDVLALDEALDALASLDCRKSRVVELRYFGGLSIEETADVLGVSLDTVKRDWRMARAWLRAELTRKHPLPSRSGRRKNDEPGRMER